jgi:hypothetical protein
MVLLRYSNITIDQATDAAVVFQGLFAHKDRIDQDKEHFYVMHLDSRRRINLVELVQSARSIMRKSIPEKPIAGQ